MISVAQTFPTYRTAAVGGAELHALETTAHKGVLVQVVAEAPLDGGRAARALLPDLLTRGTASTPSLAAMAARCEELYGLDLSTGVTAHGSRQVLRLSADFLADRYVQGPSLLDQAVELLAEVIHEPALDGQVFPADVVAQERDNLVRAIEGLFDDKATYAHRRLMETMHAGTPGALHSWGTAEEVSALTSDDATRAHAWLSGQAPLRVFVLGDVPFDRACAATERLVRGARRSPPATPVPPLPGGSREVIEASESQPLAQSKLAMGFRLPVELLPGPAAGLFALVFGGGAHSRLFKRVREAESLAYGCSASALVDLGTLIVAAGVDPDKAARVRELVVEELARLVEEGLDEEELQLSRRAQRRRLRHLLDSPRESAAFRLFGLMTGRTHDLTEALEALERVTPDEVAAVARETRLDTVFVLEGQAP